MCHTKERVSAAQLVSRSPANRTSWAIAIVRPAGRGLLRRSTLSACGTRTPSQSPARPASGVRCGPAKALFLLGKNGAPERIRTSDPQIRSLVLYPAELRARAG